MGDRQREMNNDIVNLIGNVIDLRDSIKNLLIDPQFADVEFDDTQESWEGLLEEIECLGNDLRSYIQSSGEDDSSIFYGKGGTTTFRGFDGSIGMGADLPGESGTDNVP